MFQFEAIQFKRGDKARNDAYVGKPGSISIDHETKTIRVHDGVTPGGLFSITRGADFDAVVAEFIVAEDTFTASSGENSFDVTHTDLSDVSKVKVKVNGVLTSNWSVSLNTRVTVNEPLLDNDSVHVYNYQTLDGVVDEKLARVDFTQIVSDANTDVTSIGGVEIADLVTKTGIEAALETVTMIGGVDVNTLASRASVRSSIDTATSVGGINIDDIITVNDRVDMGII